MNETKSPPIFDDYSSKGEFEEIEMIDDYKPPIYDDSPLENENKEIEDNIEIDVNEKSFERFQESEYVEIEMIEDKSPHVFVQPLLEQGFYSVDVIEEYIYDLFAQIVDMKLAREKVTEFSIFRYPLTIHSSSTHA